MLVIINNYYIAKRYLKSIDLVGIDEHLFIKINYILCDNNKQN